MATFDFEAWIAKHGLLEIRQCFIDHSMDSLSSLSMDSRSFAELVADERILCAPQLMQHIITGIQSLRSCKQRRSEKGGETKLVFMTAMEHGVFTKTQQYLHGLDRFETEFKSKLMFKQSNEQKLDEMDLDLNGIFSKLQALRSRMDEHRSYLSNVEAEYTAMTEDGLALIDEDRSYYNDSLKKCKLILEQSAERADRESAIAEIGRDIARKHRVNHC